MGIFGKILGKSEPVEEVLTAEKLGAFLYKAVTDGRDFEDKIIKKHNFEPTKKITRELLVLKIAAVDLYIHMKFIDDGEEPPFDFIADAFPDYLKKVIGEKGYSSLLTKLLTYSDAYNEPHPRGPAWQIGKVFSKEVYGDGMSASHIFLGSVIFYTTWNAIDAGLKEIVDDFGKT